MECAPGNFGTDGDEFGKTGVRKLDTAGVLAVGDGFRGMFVFQGGEVGNFEPGDDEDEDDDSDGGGGGTNVNAVVGSCGSENFRGPFGVIGGGVFLGAVGGGMLGVNLLRDTGKDGVDTA